MLPHMRHRFRALAPPMYNALASARGGKASVFLRAFATPGESSPEVPDEVVTPADRLAEGVASQFDQAAAAATTGEHTVAAHLAEQAEAAADKLEGRAGGTYQAQIEHAAANFEEVANGEASGGNGVTDQATAPVSEELETHAETLTQAASRVATQVVAGVRDGAVGVVSGIRTEVANVADHAGSIAAGGKENPNVGQAPGMEGPPSGVHYDAGPASGKGAPPSEPAEPPCTTRVHVGDRGATEARTESQTSPFSEGIWQDGGQVYDVHPGGEGADKETREQVSERAKQDAKRG